jgi:hypothetical protein
LCYRSTIWPKIYLLPYFWLFSLANYFLLFFQVFLTCHNGVPVNNSPQKQKLHSLLPNHYTFDSRNSALTHLCVQLTPKSDSDTWF